jgi:hypothetical protein
MSAAKLLRFIVSIALYSPAILCFEIPRTHIINKRWCQDGMVSASLHTNKMRNVGEPSMYACKSHAANTVVCRAKPGQKTAYNTLDLSRPLIYDKFEALARKVSVYGAQTLSTLLYAPWRRKLSVLAAPVAVIFTIFLMVSGLKRQSSEKKKLGKSELESPFKSTQISSSQAAQVDDNATNTVTKPFKSKVNLGIPMVKFNKEKKRNEVNWSPAVMVTDSAIFRQPIEVVPATAVPRKLTDAEVVAARKQVEKRLQEIEEGRINRTPTASSMPSKSTAAVYSSLSKVSADASVSARVADLVSAADSTQSGFHVEEARRRNDVEAVSSNASPSTFLSESSSPSPSQHVDSDSESTFKNSTTYSTMALYSTPDAKNEYYDESNLSTSQKGGIESYSIGAAEASELESSPLGICVHSESVNITEIEKDSDAVDDANAKAAAFASAITAGVVGFKVGGPIGAIAAAAYAHYEAKKKDNMGKVLRGVGETVVGGVELIKIVEDKFEVVREVEKILLNAVTSGYGSDEKGVESFKQAYGDTKSRVGRVLPGMVEASDVAFEVTDTVLEKAEAMVNPKYAIEVKKRNK